MKIYPKLNIFLNVLPQSFNAYHPIFSRFVLARGDLYDEMEISFGAQKFEIVGEFDCAIQDNLIYKAKEVLKESFPFLQAELEHCKVEVLKRIPQGGGLGGGSANAGVFMREIAQKFELEISEVVTLAKKVGSDVAFFVSGYESANVSGYGEIVEEFIEPSVYTYEIFTPNIFCQTKAVYQSFDELKNSELKVDFLNLSSMELLFTHSKEELNDLFLPATRVYPKLLEVSKELGEGWFFSGSGSSFFKIK